MPSFVATGYMMGMKMYMAELASTKQPAIRKMMLTVSRKTYLLPATFSSSACAALEIPCLVQTKENSVAAPMMSMMPPVVLPESTRILTSCFHLTSR